MAVLVNHSPADIVTETLPVIKLTEWYGTPGRDEVYAYARVCICSGALRVSMTVFDGTPPATQQAIAILQPGVTELQLTFTPDKRVLLTADGQAVPLPADACLFSAGADEQGWYWQGVCTLEAGLLQRCGAVLPTPGESFCGGFFLQDALEEAFGSAFAIRGGTLQDCLDTLTVIPY
ncbi:MAG: hypothetical protein IJ412_01665 [Oscillospiraceae bacterium]|nr:hypothetical protein [Oscillospiraceae bacterium]